MKNIFLYFPIILLTSLSVFYQPIMAQPASAIATLSRNKILMGDTFSISLSVQCRPEQKVTWPTLADTLGSFEIRQKSPIDTLQPNENGQMVLRQTLNLSTFEEGEQLVPSLQWQFINPANGANTLVETQPQKVQVDSLSVANQQDILPIKPPIEFPITWRDYLLYSLAILCALLLLLGLGLWYRRRKKNIVQPTTIVAPPLLPHETALQKLRTLEKGQYWQRGNIKRYYSELSDIVREYLENQFDMPAKESVTDEIMQLVKKQSQLPNTLQQDLHSLLSTADMVKFAKAQPLLETHVTMLTTAEKIIRQTANLVVPKSAVEGKNGKIGQ